MMRPLASDTGRPDASASAKSSASVKMRSISLVVRSSIETMSPLYNRGIMPMFECVPGNRLSSFADTDYHGVSTVHFRQAHMNPLARRRLDILTYVIRANGNLALAAIDQDRKLYRFSAPQIRERIERGAHRAAGVEHVI